MEMSKAKKTSFDSTILKDVIKRNFVFILLILMLIGAQILLPGYLGLNHMAGMLRIAAFLGLAAMGQTLAILTGGIDLSIEFVISFAYIIAAQVMMGDDTNILSALGIVIVFGIVVGLINGAGVCLLNVQPFIMTLGVGSVLHGAYLIFTKGAPKGSSAPLISKISNEGLIGPISGIVIVWLVFAVIVGIVLKKTPYGRKIYAVGSNATASRFSGINAKLIIFSVYILSAVIAAITGFFLIGYTGMSYLDAGSSYGISAIAAVVIGGTAITGGRGNYTGTIAGAIIMTILEDFLNAIDIQQSGRLIVQGIIILALVFIYAREKEKRI